MDSVVKPVESLGYDALAIEGGGAKGCAILGAAEELERVGILQQIKKIAGSSVGAIADLYLGSGYKVEDIRQKFFKMDFKSLLLDDSYFTTPFNWVNKFGLFDADLMHQHFRDFIKEITGNENTTFEQWHEFMLKHPEKNLKDIIVEACNINTGYNETFSHTTEHKDVPIADAIRASMAFPQVFTPVLIKGNYYNDGGMQNNCPISIVGNNALGICLEDLANIHFFLKGQKPNPKKINTVLDCFESQIEAMLNVQSYALMTGPYKDKIIYCDTLDAGTLDFGMSQETKEALRASGQYGVIRFLAINHPELAQKHYSPEILNLLKETDYPLSITEFVGYIKKNKPELRQTLKKSDALHAKWVNMPALSKTEMCGSRRVQTETQAPSKTVTLAFDQLRRGTVLMPHHASNDDLNIKDNTAVNDSSNKAYWGCTLF